MSKTFRFECGCQFDVIGECKSLSLLDVDINNLPENCPAVWDMLAKGLTTGVFQLEEYSGKSWVQKIKPRSIEELAALTALVRPGTLDSKDENGVNLTQHYVNRKNGTEEAVPLDESVKDILEETRQILTYQEQTLELVKRLAGFTLGEADLLRRGLGKKDAEIVRGCREKFIEGSKKVGLISEEKANKIFDMIQAGERYGFNKCVSGNTILRSSGNRPDITVGDLYLEWSNKWTTWDNINFAGLSINTESQIVKNQVKSIRRAGKKELFKLVFTNNSTIEVTLNHKFPIFFDGKDAELPLETILLFMNLKSDGLDSPIKFKFFDLENRTITPVRLKNIEYLGVHEVYDVEMVAPNHNFVANQGIITSNSHAIAYGIIAYRTAWEKNHFPLQFLLSKLQNAHFKQDSFEKIADLVNEAKVFNIKVKLPSLLSMRPSFWSDGKHIYYGLTDIKGIGESHFDKLQAMMSSFEKPAQDISFFEFILNACNSLGESIPNKMIRAGALDHYGMPRAEMLYYLDTMKDLTEKELVEAVHIAKEEKITDFLSLFKRIARVKKEGGVAHDKRRLGFLESKIKILQNPVAQLEDVPDCICEEEENLLGAAISTHKIDGFDSASANASCKEILCGRDDKCTIFVKITSYFPKTIKSGDNAGKEMASMVVEDNTGTLQAMVYSKEFEQFNKLLYEKACVYLEGQKQRVGNNFIVRNVWNS